jgi:hypothetical protein
MKTFAPSTTTFTVGDGGKLKGSTELNVITITGHNCTMTADKFTVFFLLVLGLHPGKKHGTERSEHSFLNMLLDNIVMISNLTAVFAIN